MVLEELLDERAMPEDGALRDRDASFYFFLPGRGGDTYTDTLVYLLIIS